LRSPVITIIIMYRGTDEASRIKKRKRRRFQSRYEWGEFYMDLYNRTLEDFDWSVNVDQPRALPITESSLQLYMHADLQRLVGVPDDDLLIPVLRQPRGAILLFMVKRFKPRLFVSQSWPSSWRNRILRQQLNANH
jgi:hypothetical protein